ncbi:MAG: hypothetical protein ACE367_09800 [Acidimicrobiales bacterium]
MNELLFPRTDAGVLAQVVLVSVLWLLAAVAVRRNRDLVWFVSGLAMLAFAWFGLRALH